MTSVGTRIGGKGAVAPTDALVISERKRSDQSEGATRRPPCKRSSVTSPWSGRPGGAARERAYQRPGSPSIGTGSHGGQDLVESLQRTTVHDDPVADPGNPELGEPRP